MGHRSVRVLRRRRRQPVMAIEHARPPADARDDRGPVVFEVVDADNRPVPPGTAGAKVLVTNLENRTLPLIRYELADRVTLSPDPNPSRAPVPPLRGDRRSHRGHADVPGAATAATVAVLPLRLGAPFARLPGCASSRSCTRPARSRSASCSTPRGPTYAGPRARRRRAGDRSRRPGQSRRTFDVTPVVRARTGTGRRRETQADRRLATSCSGSRPVVAGSDARMVLGSAASGAAAVGIRRGRRTRAGLGQPRRRR